jgi:hypothetical protein
MKYVQNWKVYFERASKNALCDVPYVIGLPGHLFQTQMYYCSANHSTDITLHKLSHYIILLNILLYIYISSSRSMCTVHSVAV